MNEAERPLISIIVPVYGIKEDYVERCLESIRSQIYTEWEVILIDDGNPEGYAQWLDHFGGPTVRVLHQENRGLSGARNRGIEEARGDWIYFCDPDDWMHTRELERLLAAGLREHADIVVCRYHEVMTEATIPEPELPAQSTGFALRDGDCTKVIRELIAPSSTDIPDQRIAEKRYGLVFAWAHLFRRELISDICFPLGMHSGEDRFFELYAAEKASCIVFVDEQLHFYRFGVGVTARFRQDVMESSRKDWELLLLFAESRRIPYITPMHLERSKMNEICYALQNYFFHPKNPAGYPQIKKEPRQYLGTEWCKRAIAHMDNPYYTVKQRIVALILRLRLYGLLKLLKYI